MVKLGLNKKIYAEISVFVVLFVLLTIQVYAQDAVLPLINRTPYTSANETSQSITANATIESRTSTETSPQPTTPTTPVVADTQESTMEQGGGQIDPNYQQGYSPQESYNATVVAETSEASVEGDGAAKSQPNQDLPKGIESLTEECRKSLNIDLSNFTLEQLVQYEKESSEACGFEHSKSPDKLYKPIITEEDISNGKERFMQDFNSFSEEEKEIFIQFYKNLTKEERRYSLKRDLPYLIVDDVLKLIEEGNTQNPKTEEIKKEEGGGFISVVTNFVVSLIDGIFSLFR